MEKIHRWILAGGGGVQLGAISPSKTSRINARFRTALNEGWSSMFPSDREPEQFCFSNENIFYCDDEVAKGGVVGLTEGGYFLCFCPRPLDPAERVEAVFFLEAKFLLEAAEDCGRAMALSPSRKCGGCRVSIARARDRESVVFRDSSVRQTRGTLESTCAGFVNWWSKQIRRVNGKGAG